MIGRGLIFILFLISCFYAKSQKSKLDSLLGVLQTAPKDTNKVKLLVKIAGRYKNTSPEKTIEYGRQALKLSQELNFLEGQFRSYYQVVHGLEYTTGYREALTIIDKWLALSDSVANRREQAQCYNMQGLMHSQLGDYSASIECYFKAIKIDEEDKNKHALPGDYGNISLVYETIKKYPIALEYINKAMQISKETGDKNGYATGLGNLSNVYDEMGDHKKALEYGLLFVKLEEELGVKSNLAGALSNIGGIYAALGQNDMAFEYYKKSLKMAEEMGNDEVIIANQINISSWYLDKNQFATSVELLKKALQLSKAIDLKPYQSECHKYLALAYRGQKDFANAYENLDRYNQLKDTLLNEENTRQINQMGAMYEKDKQQLKISALEKEQHLSELIIEKQNNFRKVLVTVVALIIILAIVLFVAFINKRKNNQLLTARNTEIEQQKEIIEESNKSMTDSINYAKRIQEAILPAKELKYKLFPDAFVFYQPRDIVSGDFYWFAEKNGKKIIAAVDCTGHGVPGAFMSMIGIDQLNHIVLQNGITQPAEILNQLQKSIRHALKQDTGDISGTKDGMDIAVCSISPSSSTKDMSLRAQSRSGKISEEEVILEYAGANRPLIIIRKNEITLETIEADRFSVGGLQHDLTKTFTNHIHSLQKGDCTYIFTDGFADQFGGPKGKKFRIKHLKELLLSISQKKMSEQEEILSKTLNEWKSKVEQIDDVLIIGVRV